jgi:hypothetical protein
VVIVDDHLALLAITGHLPDLDVAGPVATTWSFHYRLARALADTSRTGALSRRLDHPEAALRRVLNPPAHRLVVLDPRTSTAEAVRVATGHGCNLLLAELVGAAASRRAAVRVTRPNRGRTWAQVMTDEGIDFAVVEV